MILHWLVIDINGLRISWEIVEVIRL